MRFKGTWILVLLCLFLGIFIYFYEIKGGEEREKAREAEKRFWIVEPAEIEQIELLPSGETILGVRRNNDEWEIEKPRILQADQAEWNQLAEKAAELKYDQVLEETASNPAQFGLDPARSSVRIKTKENNEYTIFIGDKNPAGNRTYARVSGRNEIFLVSSLSTAFDKKLDDLRNHSVLKFEQSEVRTLDIQNPKERSIHLVKDEDDRWWIGDKGKVAADSPEIRGILNALSLGRIPEFFDEDPETYSNAGLEKPWIEASLTYGPDNAIKRLSIGPEKADLRIKGRGGKRVNPEAGAQTEIYLAKDDSRPELFFVGKDVVDKLNRSIQELRDKAIASFQRWDADSITLKNDKGSFLFKKENGEWFIGEDKKKANFDAVSGILDALSSDSLDLIDNMKSLSDYVLQEPAVHVLVKQGDKILADCSFRQKGEKTYALTSGDPAIKVVDPENYEKLLHGEADFVQADASRENEGAPAGE
jgi:hypothetical protein